MFLYKTNRSCLKNQLTRTFPTIELKIVTLNCTHHSGHIFRKSLVHAVWCVCRTGGGGGRRGSPTLHNEHKTKRTYKSLKREVLLGHSSLADGNNECNIINNRSTPTAIHCKVICVFFGIGFKRYLGGEWWEHIRYIIT